MSCLVCNSNDSILVQEDVCDLEYETYKPVKYIACKNCGLIFQNPIPSLDQIKDFYPDHYRNYLPIGGGLFSFLKSSQYKSLAKEILNLSLRNDLNNKNVLEVGFGNGYLLRVLRMIGISNLHGVDFSNAFTKDLNNEGIFAKDFNIEEDIPFDKEFDLIIMNNVIEHFIDPKKVIVNCFKKLRIGGKVVLITPNSNALEKDIFGKYWAGFHAPRHTFLFNSNNTELLAKSTGFKSVKFKGLYDPGQWAISVQNILQDSTCFKTNLTNGMSWYLTITSILFLPITFLQSFSNKNTNFIGVLEK